MAWLSAVDSNGTIVESKKYLTENLWIIMSTTMHMTRTREVTVTKFVGLTKSAAETQASTSSAVTGCTDAHTEYIGGGGYNAVQTIETITEWQDV